MRYNVSVQIDKTTTSRKTIKLEIGTNPLRAVREGGNFFGKPIAAHPDKLSG